MIELVEYLVSALVPDGDYTVEMREDVSSVDIVVTIAKKDIGKVIGKQGRIAKAIRVVMRAAANRRDTKISVEID